MAEGLGLTGRARNLSDGRVEVVVSGPAPQVEALCAWLWQGPPMARVDAVECEDLPYQALAGFSSR
jgi:acylphosphatase